MSAATVAAATAKRRTVIGRRRRVEDEDEEGPDTIDHLDDDSMTEGSISDDHDHADDSDSSNIDEIPVKSPAAREAAGQQVGKPQSRRLDRSPSTGNPSSKNVQPPVSDTEIMLNGLSLADKADSVEAIDFDDMDKTPRKAPAPMVVSSASAPQPAKQEPRPERPRREHDEYRRKRDEDPAFVPNRGAFFMHDHRAAGPSANGFRPFPRGARGGRGRGGIGGPFAPMHQFQPPRDPTTSAPWAHDMHDAVASPYAARGGRHLINDEGPPNGNGIIPTCPPNPTPINRTLSTERVQGLVPIKVFFPGLKAPSVLSSIPMKTYTKLPDHRPPLRRDKPVRISLPNHPPRYIFPANDRSFIFIPRAMRPNQQRVRGRPRSTLGSISGFSRRTSAYGGSYYGGSVYSPSVAMSRRSSIAPDMGRDYIISPAGSAISRPPMPVDTSRPVVRLPPAVQAEQVAAQPPGLGPAGYIAAPPPGVGEVSITNLPQPQMHPLPQKPHFQENRTTTLEMHQPRPQKTVKVDAIESPTHSMNTQPQPYQQAFHQQVPVQVANGVVHGTHSRNPSYPSTGTPLSQIPERAIHAAPFQPNTFAQQAYYGPPYQAMQQQPGYYYPPPYNAPSAVAPAFVPGSQPPPMNAFQPPNQSEGVNGQANGQGAGGQNLIAQEANGMVYYYDASQITYPQFPAPPQAYGPGDMMTPSPENFYYPQPGPGMVYYSQ